MAVVARYGRQKLKGAQYEALHTECQATKILETETGTKCRWYQQYYQTIDHIVSACSILANEQYTKRHDVVCDNCALTYGRKQG